MFIRKSRRRRSSASGISGPDSIANSLWPAPVDVGLAGDVAKLEHREGCADDVDAPDRR
jgi:hypothetical protein